MIPKIVHHIHLTDTPIKSPNFRLSFMLHNIKWSFMFWSTENIHEADISGDIKRMVKDPKISYVVRGDCLRHAILFAYGGIYADTDMLCLRSLDPLLGTHGFSSESYFGQTGNALLGCVPGYPIMGKISQLTYNKILDDAGACNRDPPHTVGVDYQSVFLRECETIHPRHYFQPFSWKELDGRNQSWPESYTVHHWHGMDANGWTKKRFP